MLNEEVPDLANANGVKLPELWELAQHLAQSKRSLVEGLRIEFEFRCAECFLELRVRYWRDVIVFDPWSTSLAQIDLAKSCQDVQQLEKSNVGFGRYVRSGGSILRERTASCSVKGGRRSASLGGGL
jgi:hypothetical protein